MATVQVIFRTVRLAPPPSFRKHTMSGQLHALLVGINDYPSRVRPLNGCRNDVERMQEFLMRTFLHMEPRILTLLDSDATRANIIDQFDKHLGKAGKDDIVLFHYSGHGARWRSAPEFKEWFPEELDETLVCVDSRNDGGYDLADKELAFLLSQLAVNGPQIAVLLDCCHSGSGTRGLEDFQQLQSRQTHQVDTPRPLESYLGNYAEQVRAKTLAIPASPHVLMAACERFQQAWEGTDCGMFSQTLREILERTRAQISYAELFTRCRAEIRRRVKNQDPQFETYGGFPALSGFLGALASQQATRYTVSFCDGDWKAECGAVHGIPTEKPAELALFAEGEAEPIGRATTQSVMVQESVLDVGGTLLDPALIYQAAVTSLPVPPLVMTLEGDPNCIARFQQFVAAKNDGTLGVAFVETGHTKYRVEATPTGVALYESESGQLIRGFYEAAENSDLAASELYDIVKEVAAWERAVNRQNQRTRMNPANVEFCFKELTSAGEVIHKESRLTLTVETQPDGRECVFGRFEVTNNTAQTLHYVLLIMEENFRIDPVLNERGTPSTGPMALSSGDGSDVTLELTKANDETILFQLIVSTEKIEQVHQLGQEGFLIGEWLRPRSSRAAVTFGQRKLIYRNEWFTKNILIRLVRNSGAISGSDMTIAGSLVTVHGHQALTGQVNLGVVEPIGLRSVGLAADLNEILTTRVAEIVPLIPSSGATRGGLPEPTVLELTGLKNVESLAIEPLTIDLNVPLATDESLLTVTFDGEDLLIVGEAVPNDAGGVRIEIREIPDTGPRQRSLGRALKLYFLKMIGSKNLQSLRRVTYACDGTPQHDEATAEAVTAATNVVLLIHGIIGNTDSIVAGLRLAKLPNGRTLDQTFDLVLTFDYENLNTPIEQTARALKEKLETIGLKKGDGKRLTIISHSMGGLVSRWFIERDDGIEVVDHLVMFGTPNAGSPFGYVDSARQLATLLTTLALNAFPALAPFGSGLVWLLNRSARLTPTLEQMNPESKFIKELNESPDPGIRYTILAGDIREYDASKDALFARLLAKVARGRLFELLYQQSGHDIAVRTDSIRGVAETRSPVPGKQNLVCHHLNYFSSDVGLKAMAEIVGT
jgi:pimeloyl-ACP methyl ester carboxylesterase